MSEEAPSIEITALLCDSAAAVGGKLYILGAGWSRVITEGRPLTMALAIHLGVPWHDANHPLELRIDLVDADRKIVMGANNQPMVRVEGRMEVGRPPGLKPGTVLDSSFAVPIEGLTLAPGFYQWDVSITDSSSGQRVTKSLRFEVVQGPAGVPLQS